MATIQKREGVNGPSYRVLVRHRGHAPEYRTFKKLTDAKAFAAKADTAINDGAGSTLREAKKRTLAEAITKYAESVIAARTDQSTKKHYAFWTERLGHMRIGNITADVIAAVSGDVNPRRPGGEGAHFWRSVRGGQGIRTDHPHRDDRRCAFGIKELFVEREKQFDI